ncbi:MAG: serine/threonine-protein kinase, partial [Isosphaeraceae bacterium]
MIGTTLNQRFVLEKELGRGGMGAVYRATDQILQRTVAIKILKDLGGEEVGRKLCLEAQVLARLLHDNIVRLYDFNQNDGTYYFIMEEVDGTSFHKRWKRVTLPERLRMLAQVADALDYAHRQGVIHRDVKPANILLTSTDQTKLSDFGLSVQMGESQESGVVRGTPHYMSPEQAKGKRLDHRTDLYSLGVLLYECATGTPPFQGSSLEIMTHHVHTAVEPPRARSPEISPDLEELILDLLAKAPDARPGSGREVAERLRALAIALEDPTTAVGEPGSSSGSFLTSQANPGVLPATVAAIPAARSRTTSRPGATPGQTLIEVVEADPIPLSPAERYLTGHYLAYLLGGSRRRGFLLRRPLDPLNADRARLLLAMTYLSVAGASDETVNLAASLMDSRVDVRPSLSPIVVAKYLIGRDSPGKRRKFRQTRQQLQEASTHARDHLTDSQGVLNPGLMPQVLDDLKKLAPSMSEVNDQLVQRWNRVAEVWRGNPIFRDAVLRYATKEAWRDPNSGLLWPEVVYPLIERARWQRRARSSYEAVRDAVFAPLHLPDAGNRLDQVIKQTVPQQMVEQLDDELSGFIEDPGIEDEPAAEPSPESVSRPSLSGIRAESFQDIGNDDPEPNGLVRLTSPDPVRLTQGDLRLLWQEGI